MLVNKIMKIMALGICLLMSTHTMSASVNDSNVRHEPCSFIYYLIANAKEDFATLMSVPPLTELPSYFQDEYYKDFKFYPFISDSSHFKKGWEHVISGNLYNGYGCYIPNITAEQFDEYVRIVKWDIEMCGRNDFLYKKEHNAPRYISYQLVTIERKTIEILMFDPIEEEGQAEKIDFKLMIGINY